MHTNYQDHLSAKNVSVLLAPNVEQASKVDAAITIEAEYGEKVVEGRRYTAAHHQKSGPYQGRHTGGRRPSPCNDQEIPLVQAGETILLSHLDLDSIGGTLRAVLGSGHPIFEHHCFWADAEFVDTRGAHRLSKSSPYRFCFWAWWAYLEENRPKTSSKVISDVSGFIEESASALEKILCSSAEMISAGMQWEKRQQHLNSSSHIGTFLSRSGRTVITRKSDKFVNHLYIDPAGNMASAIVSMNTALKTCTISFPEERSDLSCVSVVQSVWPEVWMTAQSPGEGSEPVWLGIFPSSEDAERIGRDQFPDHILVVGHTAGGHPAIAGSPRGVEMGDADFSRLIEAARSLV